MSRGNLHPVVDPLPRDIYHFWCKVIQGEGCWIWDGTVRNIKGRLIPIFGMQGTNYIATRVAWRICNGFDPGEYLVLHDCPRRHNSLCVRHIYLGTHEDNMHDKILNGTNASGYRTKLWPSHVKEIHRLWSSGEHTQTAIAKMYGVTQGMIGHIVRGQARQRDS